MSLRTEDLDTPAKLQAAMEASIAHLDSVDHGVVSGFVEATDAIHKTLPLAEKAYSDIASDIAAVGANQPPGGAEELVALIEMSEE